MIKESVLSVHAIPKTVGEGDVQKLQSPFTCHGLGCHNMEFISDVVKGDETMYFIDWKGNRKRHSQFGEGILSQNVSK